MNKKHLELSNKYIELLNDQVDNSDTELAHVKADDYLCELLNDLGFKNVVAIYQEVSKWYEQ